jgi:hypothetical protein
MPTTLASPQTSAKKCPYGDGARFNAGELATTKASPTSQEISAQGKKYQRGRARLERLGDLDVIDFHPGQSRGVPIILETPNHLARLEIPSFAGK